MYFPGNERVHGKFQLAFPTGTRFLCLVLRVAFPFAAPAWDDNGQTMLPTQLIAHIPYAVIAALIGIVLVVVNKIDRAKNDVVMDMPLVYVGS